MKHRFLLLAVAGIALGPLVQGVERSAQDLVEALREDDDRTAQAAQEMLSQMGQDAVRPLQKALGDSNFKVRKRAAEVLGRLGPEAKRAAPELVELLTDAQFDVRAAAEKALIQMGDDALPALKDALRSDKEGLRKVALDAISRCGPRGIPILIELLKKDESALIRASAAEALGAAQPATTDSVQALVQALSDLDDNVRGPAVDSLAQLGPASIPAVKPLFTVSQEDKNLLVRDKARKALLQIGSTSKEAAAAVAGRWESLLKNEDTYVRAQALAMLGELGPAGLPGLIQALGDRDSALGDAAAKGIIQLGQDAVPALQTLLHGNDPYLQRKAGELLRRIERKPRRAKK